MADAEFLADPAALLAELGPLIEAAEIHAHGDDTWLVYLDEDFALLVERDDERQVLVLTTELGLAQPGHELQVYRQLLQVACRWREVGGTRMGLEPEDDTIVQLTQAPLAGLGLQGLRGLVERFVSQARHGRAVLAAVQGDGPPAGDFVRV